MKSAKLSALLFLLALSSANAIPRGNALARRDGPPGGGHGDDGEHNPRDMELDGSQRKFRIKADDKSVLIRGFAADDTTGVKSGYHLITEVRNFPSVGFRLFSRMGGRNSNETNDAAFSGMRINIQKILEIGANNNTIREFNLKDLKDNWGPLTLTPDTVAKTYTVNGTASGTIDSTPFTFSIESFFTPESAQPLTTDRVKFSVALYGWPKDAGSRLALDFGILSTSSNDVVKGDERTIVSDNSKFTWDGQAYADGVSVNTITYPIERPPIAELPQGEVDNNRHEREGAFRRLRFVFNETSAFNSFYWDPSVGSASADIVGVTSAGVSSATVTNFAFLFLTFLMSWWLM